MITKRLKYCVFTSSQIKNYNYDFQCLAIKCLFHYFPFLISYLLDTCILLCVPDSKIYVLWSPPCKWIRKGHEAIFPVISGKSYSHRQRQRKKMFQAEIVKPCFPLPALLHVRLLSCPGPYAIIFLDIPTFLSMLLLSSFYYFRSLSN